MALTSQEDLGGKFFLTNTYYRKNENRLRDSVEETAGAIRDAQGSADRIIDNTVDPSSDSVNEYGFNKKALDNTSRLCQIVSNKCRKIIKNSGRRHIHLDTFALKNATLFEDIAKQMKEKGGYVGYYSKFGMQKYDYNDFKISDNEKNYNGDSKKGGFLLNNHFPYGIFVGAEKNDDKIKKTRLNSIISCISKRNVLQSKKLYADLSEKNHIKSEVGYKANLLNESIAFMMANDIRLYVNELIDSFLSESVKDVLMLKRFGNHTEFITIFNSKLNEAGMEMKTIQDKIKQILANDDSYMKT